MKGTLEIGQSSRYIDDRWWSFSVWIEGTEAQLEEIELVRYFLHPSFRNPVRTRTRREDKFRLTERARGGFTLSAELVFKTGESRTLSQPLALEATEGDAASQGKEPVVFLSGSAADGEALEALGRALRRRRIQVVTTEVLGRQVPGLPFEELIQRAMAQASSAVVLTSAKPSLWVHREIEQIRKHDLPVVVVQVGERKGQPAGLEDAPSFELREPDDVSAVANEIASRVR